MRIIGRHITTALVALGMLGAGQTVSNRLSAAEIQPREGWSTFFGDQRVKLHFDVRHDQQLNGQLLWNHSANERTLSRGETPLRVSPSEPAAAEIELNLPPVRSGVVFDTLLRLQLTDAAGDVVAELERSITLFPTNPFDDRSEWLDELNLVLFDPEETTEDALNGLDIPFQVVRAPSGLAREDAKVAIVGEGTSLGDYRSLFEEAAKFAAAGGSVIFLAPADGEFPFPDGAEDLPKSKSVSLRRKDVIDELDKRLDSDAWPEEGRVVKVSFQTNAARRNVELNVVPSSEGWSWVEVVYPGGGRLLVCGFAMIDTWDASPTPRWLLLRMLERVSKKSKGTKSLSEKE